MKTYIPYLLNSLWVVLSLLFILLPALQNGFPLLHSDSGTYILVGFEDYIPVSRPITYCWLVRHISMSYSLWLVIILQAMLVVSFLNVLVHKLVGSKNSILITFIIISILTAFTSLPITVCHIMPDIFISFAFIGLFIILTFEKLSLFWKIVLPIAVIYSIIVHNSNIPVISGFIIGGVVLFYLFKRFNFIFLYPKRLIIVLIILIMAWVSIPLINASYGIGFKYSRVSNIIFTARLIHSGILADFVTEKCETDTNYFLCEYKNAIPNYIQYHYFLWHDSSFLYQQDCEDTKGFAECWIKRDSIYGTVVKEIMSTPKYQSRYLSDALHQVGNQLVTFHSAGDPPFGAKSHINYPIKRFFQDDYKNYLGASQQNCAITYTFRNFAQTILLILSIVVITIFLSLKRLRKFVSIEIRTFLVFFLVLILVNAVLIGFVSIVVGRFEGRLIWLLPFIAMMLLARFFNDYNKEGGDGKSI